MNMMRVFKLLIMGFATMSLVKCARKCSTECNEKIDLVLPLQKLSIVQNITLNVVIHTVEEKISATIGLRKYRNVLTLNEFGEWPEVNEVIFMPPNKLELGEWKSKEMCKIGTRCAPNGECWGSAAQFCKDNSLKEWVPSSHFEYEGVNWNKDLFRTCIKEWECWTIEREYNLYMDLENGPTLMIDEDEISLSVNKLTYRIIKNIAFLFETPHIIYEKRQIQCLKHDSDVFCEIEVNGSVQIFSFISNSTCTTISRNLICIEGKEDNKRKDGINTLEKGGSAATKEDLHIIGEEMRASFVESMYNDMSLRSMLQKVMNVLLKSIKSQSRYNNMILHDIMDKDVASYWNSDGIKACSCLPANRDSCEWSQSLLRTTTKTSGCSEIHNATISKINLFGEDNFNHMMPDTLTLKSVGKPILETIEEQELMADKKSRLSGETGSGGSVSVLSAIGFGTVKSLIWEYLPLLNLVLVLLMLARNFR